MILEREREGIPYLLQVFLSTFSSFSFQVFFQHFMKTINKLTHTHTHTHSTQHTELERPLMRSKGHICHGKYLMWPMLSYDMFVDNLECIHGIVLAIILIGHGSDHVVFGLPFNLAGLKVPRVSSWCLKETIAILKGSLRCWVLVSSGSYLGCGMHKKCFSCPRYRVTCPWISE